MYGHPFAVAEAYLEEGQPLPLDVAAQLMERGVDVPAFERNFTNKQES